MKMIYKIILSGFLLVSATKLTAQIVFQTEGGDKGDLVASVVYIVNSGRQNIKFQLSLNRDHWQTFELKPAQSGMAWPKNVESYDYLHIRVSTNNEYVQYRLKKEKRFRIFWNGNNNRWDVSTIEPENR